MATPVGQVLQAYPLPVTNGSQIIVNGGSHNPEPRIFVFNRKKRITQSIEDYVTELVEEKFNEIVLKNKHSLNLDF